MEAATGGKEILSKWSALSCIRPVYTLAWKDFARARIFFRSARGLEFSFEFAPARRGRRLRQRSAIFIINRGRSIANAIRKHENGTGTWKLHGETCVSYWTTKKTGRCPNMFVDFNLLVTYQQTRFLFHCVCFLQGFRCIRLPREERKSMRLIRNIFQTLFVWSIDTPVSARGPGLVCGNVYRPRGNDANPRKLTLTLPLEQQSLKCKDNGSRLLFLIIQDHRRSENCVDSKIHWQVKIWITAA